MQCNVIYGWFLTSYQKERKTLKQWHANYVRETENTLGLFGKYKENNETLSQFEIAQKWGPTKMLFVLDLIMEFFMYHKLAQWFSNHSKKHLSEPFFASSENWKKLREKSLRRDFLLSLVYFSIFNLDWQMREFE